MSDPERSPEHEHQYHHYRSNQIPWFVRLMWLGFWIFAVTYTILYMFPAIREELFSL